MDSSNKKAPQSPNAAKTVGPAGAFKPSLSSATSGLKSAGEAATGAAGNAVNSAGKITSSGLNSASESLENIAKTQKKTGGKLLKFFKFSDILMLLTTTLLAVLIITAIVFFEGGKKEKDLIKTDGYQAVHIDDAKGTTYFAKLTMYNRDIYALVGAYTMDEDGKVMSSASQKYCPISNIFIDKEKVLYWENLNENSPVAKDIQAMASQEKNCDAADATESEKDADADQNEGTNADADSENNDANETTPAEDDNDQTEQTDTTTNDNEATPTN